MNSASIIALLLGTIAAAMVGVWVLAGEADRRRSLLRDTGAISHSRLGAFRAGLELRLTRTAVGARLRRALTLASVTQPLADVVLIVAGGSVLVLSVANSLGGPVLLGGAAIGIVLGLRGFLGYRRRQRLERFIEQLPELAQLLANATQAGLSLTTALKVAANETLEPVRSELEQVNREIALGQRLEDALARLGDRLPSRELAVLVNVLVIQIRAGGQVVSALRGVTRSLETRRSLRREVRTLLAASKATMVAVVLLGFIIVAITQTQIPGGLRGLLAEPIGVAIAAVSVTLFVVGIGLVSRISRVEV